MASTHPTDRKQIGLAGLLGRQMRAHTDAQRCSLLRSPNKQPVRTERRLESNEAPDQAYQTPGSPTITRGAYGEPKPIGSLGGFQKLDP